MNGHDLKGRGLIYAVDLAINWWTIDPAKLCKSKVAGGSGEVWKIKRVVKKDNCNVPAAHRVEEIIVGRKDLLNFS